MAKGRRVIWEKLNAELAAWYINVSVRTLDRYCARGILKPSYTPGGHRRFSVAQLNPLRNQRTNPKRRSGKRAKPRQTATRATE